MSMQTFRHAEPISQAEGKNIHFKKHIYKFAVLFTIFMHRYFSLIICSSFIHLHTFRKHKSANNTEQTAVYCISTINNLAIESVAIQTYYHQSRLSVCLQVHTSYASFSLAMNPTRKYAR